MQARMQKVVLPSNATIAEHIAAEVDEPDVRDWVFRQAILRKFPERFAEVIAKEYTRIHRTQSRRDANLFMLDIKDQLSSQILGLAASDDEIVSYAKKRADEMQRLMYNSISAEFVIQCLCDIAFHKYGVFPPIKTKLGADTVPVTVTVPDRDRNESVTVLVSAKGVIGRLCDERWWRRSLRRLHIRNVEKKAIELGLVRAGREKYVSNVTLQHKRQQAQRNRKILEQCIATNELEQTYTLQELSDLSVSNPKIQRNELMTRLAGFDKLALDHGHVGVVYTVTCPSRMHASMTKDGKTQTNPNYDGTTPADAQKHLSTVWARIRAKLDRMGIKVYGFRVAEPHQDATPHWHALLYMDAKHEASVQQVIRQYALQDSPNENGAQKHRVNAVKIDRSKGTGTSYLAKYISKGIDGHGLDMDIDGGEPTSAAEKVKAWAATWGVRQFQQIGGPSVTLWRELRRLGGNGLPASLKAIWDAANEGLWDAFVMLMGGPFARRDESPISIAKQWNDKLNRYGEPIGEEVIGIAYGNIVIPTRIHQWTITHQPHQQKTEIRPIKAIAQNDEAFLIEHRSGL